MLCFSNEALGQHGSTLLCMETKRKVAKIEEMAIVIPLRLRHELGIKAKQESRKINETDEVKQMNKVGLTLK